MCKYCDNTGWKHYENSGTSTKEALVSGKELELYTCVMKNERMHESYIKVPSKYCFNCGRKL